MSITKPNQRVEKSTYMVCILALSALIIFASSCQLVGQSDKDVDSMYTTQTSKPVNQATATREASPTQTPNLLGEAIEEASTRQASYIATPVVVATPTTPPTLPVSHIVDFPGKPVKLNADNISQIQLIGTFGEGQHFSTHYNKEGGRLVLVYSTGIDIFQNSNDEIRYQRSYDFDIPIMDFAYNEESDLYKVSPSTKYFVQDYGSRFRLLSLETGEEHIIFKSGQILQWFYYSTEITFSPDERYLIINTYSEIVLIDLNEYKEIFRKEKGKAYFSANGNYFIVGIGTQFDVYELATLELINSVKGTTSPEFATITSNQKLITVFANVIMVWSFPNHDFLGLIYTGGRSNFIRGRYNTVTSDGKLLITADYDKVRIWNLETFEYDVVFYEFSRFELSPDETYLFIIGKLRTLINLEDYQKIATFNLSVNLHTQFSTDSRYFIAHAGNGTWVYDFDNEININVYTYDDDQPGYGRFLGASGDYLWMYIDYINEPANFYRYNISTGEKTPFNKSILNSTNMDFYCDEFSLIITDTNAEIRSLDNMSLINQLSPYRTSGRSHMDSLIDFSNYLWYGEYQLDLNMFSSSIKWNVDYDHLSIAFAHVSSRVRYNEFKIFVKSIMSPDGKLRVEAGQNSENSGKVFIYLTEDDTLYREFTVYTKVYDWAFSPDSTLIYITGSVERPDYPEWIRVFNIPENRLLNLMEYKAIIKRELSTQNLLAIPIDVSPDGRYLATGNELGQIQVFDLERYWSVAFTLDTYLDSFSDLQFSPDGSYLATATGDDTIQFWETNTGELLWELDVLGSFDLQGSRMIQFYLMDNMIVTTAKADPWGRFGQIKIFGIIED